MFVKSKGEYVKNKDVFCCYATYNHDFVLHFFTEISEYGIHIGKKKHALCPPTPNFLLKTNRLSQN